MFLFLQVWKLCTSSPAMASITLYTQRPSSQPRELISAPKPMLTSLTESPKQRRRRCSTAAPHREPAINFIIFPAITLHNHLSNLFVLFCRFGNSSQPTQFQFQFRAHALPCSSPSLLASAHKFKHRLCLRRASAVPSCCRRRIQLLCD